MGALQLFTRPFIQAQITNNVRGGGGGGGGGGGVLCSQWTSMIRDEMALHAK